MDDRPLGPLLTELGMHLLTRLLVPVRRRLFGDDAWTNFFTYGHDGRPWWHYREDETGRLVLIRAGVPEPIRPAAPIPAPTAAARPVTASSGVQEAGGVSIVLPCGRSTTPIADYSPVTHEPLIAALDLLLYLIDHYESTAIPRRTLGPPIVRAARSMSLLARDWGHWSGQGERRADRAIALLGERAILDRVVVGARMEYRLPSDAAERFGRTAGFTVLEGSTSTRVP
jgi:hypothetical protein